MGYGDEILAAGQAQRWYDDCGDRSVIVDLNAKPRWHPIWEGNPVIVRPGEDRPGDHVLLSAPNARPYIVYPFTQETGWTFNREFRARDHRARIYLTDDEKQRGLALREVFGPYVLFDPWSKHPNLRWPLEYWERLLAICDDVKFVQQLYPHGAPLIQRAYPVETASFREACALLVHASAYIRGESGMCHAAAALGIPQVTIWGGCMDWDVLGGYPGQIGVGISNPPCGRYLPCDHCRSTMAAISPETVAEALQVATAPARA